MARAITTVLLTSVILLLFFVVVVCLFVAVYEEVQRNAQTCHFLSALCKDREVCVLCAAINVRAERPMDGKSRMRHEDKG